MEGWIVIILIAVILFAGFIIYDKRKFIADKIKNVSFPKQEKKVKEKPAKEKNKTKKHKQEVKEEKPIDYDTVVLEDNVVFGKEIEEKVENDEDIPIMFSDSVNESADDDDIDLDQLFEQLRQSDAENSQKYRMDKFNDDLDFPSFDDMSSDDIDDFLENSFSYDELSDGVKSSMSDYGYKNNLSGKELGDMLKKLPPEVKALIIGDILKPKF